MTNDDLLKKAEDREKRLTAIERERSETNDRPLVKLAITENRRLMEKLKTGFVRDVDQEERVQP